MRDLLRSLIDIQHVLTRKPDSLPLIEYPIGPRSGRKTHNHPFNSIHDPFPFNRAIQRPIWPKSLIYDRFHCMSECGNLCVQIPYGKLSSTYGPIILHVL